MKIKLKKKVPLFFKYFERKPVFSALINKFLVTNSLFAVSYYLIQAFAISFSNPLFFSVGSLLKIPISSMIDAIFRHTKFSIVSIFGLIFLCVGIIVINFKTFHDLFVEHKRNQDQQLEEKNPFIN